MLLGRTVLCCIVCMYVLNSVGEAVTKQAMGALPCPVNGGKKDFLTGLSVCILRYFISPSPLLPSLPSLPVMREVPFTIALGVVVETALLLSSHHIDSLHEVLVHDDRRFPDKEGERGRGKGGR